MQYYIFGLVNVRVILLPLGRSGKRRLSWRRHVVRTSLTDWTTCQIFIRTSWLLSNRFVFI